MNVEINVKKASLEIGKTQKPNIKIGATYTEKLLANDYNTLKNQPSIEGVKLINDKTFEDLGAISLSNLEIENLINSQI